MPGEVGSWPDSKRRPPFLPLSPTGGKSEQFAVRTSLHETASRALLAPHGKHSRETGLVFPAQWNRLTQIEYLSGLAKGRCTMKSVLNKLMAFVKDESGPTAVEYAVMLALIIVVCITAITALGTNANNTFSYVGTKVGGTGS
jgi:pilus assembly protein Flp/PilA